MGEKDQKVEDVEALVVCKPFGKGRTGEQYDAVNAGRWGRLMSCGEGEWGGVGSAGFGPSNPGGLCNGWEA